MSDIFEHLILEHLFESNKTGTKQEHEDEFDAKEFNKIYNKIIDLAVINTFENIVDNELLCLVFRRLSRTERLIIMFNILMDYKGDATAKAIGVNTDTVYRLKHRALKKFQAALEGLEE